MNKALALLGLASMLAVTPAMAATPAKHVMPAKHASACMLHGKKVACKKIGTRTPAHHISKTASHVAAKPAKKS